MRCRAAPARRQAGAALLILVAAAVLAFAYMIVNHLNAATGFRDVRVSHNAKVLNQAKQVLIGYVAQRAALGDDPSTLLTVEGRNPGSLPCPEAPGNFGTNNEGIAAPACAAPAIGRLPWRTLGLDKLTDAAGEPLWYAISPGWHLPNTSASTIINSNSIGQLNVDGVPNDAVALIIAPGPAITTQASAGCTSPRNQSHPQTAGSLDRADYLECENAAGAAFVTNRSIGDFNDQVLRITVADIMPAIEAAIAVRIEREIVPQLRSAYAAGWGTNVSGANPIYPFPAGSAVALTAGTLADPGTAASFNGSTASCNADLCSGLLPVRFNNAPGSTDLCTPAAGSLCDPEWVTWTSATIQTQGASLSLLGLPLLNVGTTSLPLGLGTLIWTPTQTPCNVIPTDTSVSPPIPASLDCPLRAPSLTVAGIPIVTSDVRYEIRGVANNVAMSMRQFTPAALSGVTLWSGVTNPPTISVNGPPAVVSDPPLGSATITIVGRGTPSGGGVLLGLCNLTGSGLSFLLGLGCTESSVSVPMTLLPDHALLDANNATTGWFVRNEWYRVMYYSAARSATAMNLPAAPTCSATGTITCLEVDASTDKRALLILAGRTLTPNTARPNTDLSDFLDSAQNRSFDRRFTSQPVNRSFNDRIITANP